MKHANVAVFVPHLGCPNRCSFCDQKEISGASDAPDASTVTKTCLAAESELSRGGRSAELAFFGGSFTAIDRKYMLELLGAAQPFIERGVFTGIRISTRPDCVDNETLELLRRYNVRAIELGAQSMDDRVLSLNLRGHTAADVEAAARRIRDAGLELGLQMMTGLYGSDDDIDYATAQKLVALRPATVRIYPTVVMEHTLLAKLYREGSYEPPPLAAAVALGARLLKLFGGEGIRVIRMGLHAQESLQSGMIAGPYHPAFRELCEGELMRRRAMERLSGKPKGEYTVAVSPRSVSKIVGHGSGFVDGLRELGYHVKMKQDNSLADLDVMVG